MDMDDDGVTDPTAEFGELFEGQTAFESDLGVHADDVLGAIGHELNLGASRLHHGASHHPSDHEILSANLNYVPDDYLQHQHVGVDNNEQLEYTVTIPDVSGLVGDAAGSQQQGVQQFYIQANQNEVHQQIQLDDQGTSLSFQYTAQQQEPLQPAYQSATDTLTFVNEQPRVKQKVKVVKDVEYFTSENMGKYLKRRGFKIKGGGSPVKSISKAVLALTADSQMSNGHSKLISAGSRYEPENIIQELERFWKFYLSTKARNVMVSDELLPMLIPMLLYFYFQMMLGNMLPIARRLIMEFSKKFLLEGKSQQHYEILVAIMKITSPEMLKRDAILSQLINVTYEFTLSELPLIQLRRFLSTSNQPILLNLFTDRFRIRSRESKELIESIDWETMLLDSDGSESDDVENQSVSSDSSSISKEKSYVQDVIDELRNSVSANLPAVSVYTTGDNPICGAVSKNGTLVAYGLAEAGIRLYSVENARDVTRLKQNQKTEPNPLGLKTLGGHSGAVYGIQFHPRTKLLFSAGQDCLMRAWDLNTEHPRCRAVYRGHTGPVWKLDIPESGSLVATAGLDTTARIFVPERTEFVRVMVGHYFSVNTVKFHPNESYIGTGSSDKSVRLWSVNDGNLVRMFTGSSGSVSALAFHHTGKYLAGAGEDNKIVIWDLAEGETIATLDSFPNCKDLAFNGSMLTACYRNGVLQIFNLRPILGGSAGVEELFDQPPPSIATPYTSQCFAKTLFKCHYKDSGMLFCLGSALTEEEVKTEEEGSASTKCGTKSIARQNNSASSSTILHQVLQSRSTTNESNPATPTNASSILVTTTSSNSNSILGPSRILAARLSQPSSLSGGENEEGATIGSVEGPLSVGTSAMLGGSQILTPLSSDPNLLHTSPLDAALSVLDQDGNSSGGGGGGTITMYALG